MDSFSSAMFREAFHLVESGVATVADSTASHIGKQGAWKGNS